MKKRKESNWMVVKISLRIRPFVAFAIFVVPNMIIPHIIRLAIGNSGLIKTLLMLPWNTLIIMCTKNGRSTKNSSRPVPLLAQTLFWFPSTALPINIAIKAGKTINKSIWYEITMSRIQAACQGIRRVPSGGIGECRTSKLNSRNTIPSLIRHCRESEP